MRDTQWLGVPGRVELVVLGLILPNTGNQQYLFTEIIGSLVTIKLCYMFLLHSRTLFSSLYVQHKFLLLRSMIATAGGNVVSCDVSIGVIGLDG